MRKFYDKNEVLFAIIWIVAYCVVIGSLKGNIGTENIVTLAALAAFTAGITAFVKLNHLEEKYGLVGWPANAKKCLFFIPLFVLATGNAWGGFKLNYQGSALICAVLSMILIGYVEEMIFRGFLFKAMLEKNKPVVAIIVSAVTFGVGHIVNLFTGQATFKTVIQIVFAVSLGFIFTLVFYRSGSLIPCIIAHSMIDALSVFAVENETLDWIYVGLTIVVSVIYSIYLAKTP